MQRIFNFGFLILLLAMGSSAYGDIIVDFTSAGLNGTLVNTGLTFSTSDPSGTGVSFDVTASAVIPTGGGANNGDIVNFNGGVGSEVENTGDFLNNINNVPEVLRFSISNVSGLNAGDQLQLTNLLSQNPNSQTANQSGGYGGTFGEQAADSVTISTSLGASFVVNQSDNGDTGSILLNGDNGQSGNTGNTFQHSAGNLDLTSLPTFDIQLTDLSVNNAVVIQGFEFSVIPAAVPEPSSLLALSMCGLGLLVRRRR